MKNIEWLKNRLKQTVRFDALNDKEIGFKIAMDEVLSLINQLDEPEVLSQEWIDKHSVARYHGFNPEPSEYIPVGRLQNLLVPEQEEADQAYKAGYETGKQHTFYKGYLEGLEDKGSEPETVADVVTTFWKSYERLKEVMSMEVEELEE